METIKFKENETSLVVLPDEVKELAKRVPEEKQKEVQTVLSQIFAGTADWKKQAEAIEVKDIHDSMSIQIADAGRKNVKNARLAAEKIFDAKRDEVQQKKSEYDLEDKLWLKAKQTAQILFKDIESIFEWKANFVKRYEAEQKELQTQLRIEKCSKYVEEINRIEIENMSDDLFNIFLSGIEKNYNDRIAAEKKAEEDRLADLKATKIYDERVSYIVAKRNFFWDNLKTELVVRITKETTKDEWDKIVLNIKSDEAKFVAEKKEVEKQLADEKKKAEEKAKALEVEREKTRKDNEEKERLAEIERKKNADILKAEQEKAAKERAELLAKAEAERKEKERLANQEAARLKAIEDQKKAMQKAEKAAKLAPDKDKLLAFGQSINDLPRPEIKSIEAAAVMAQINGLLVKLNNYIVTEANKL